MTSVVELEVQFEHAFRKLPGHFPLRWLSRPFAECFGRGELPRAVDVPTGLGKTALMALWLIARAAGAALPCEPCVRPTSAGSSG